MTVLHDDLADLSSAEDFLNYFGIEFDQAVVHVNRLHILQRFHDYLKESAVKLAPEPVKFVCYQESLQRAYRDFVVSDAATEKVFKVFQQQPPASPEPLTLVQIEG
ncbi:MAG: nitrogen fixation protein NifW [Pseudomonadales bacterium]|nr:nitrogen fixation protein NifW [Pseudomonadales bacterium]